MRQALGLVEKLVEKPRYTRRLLHALIYNSTTVFTFIRRGRERIRRCDRRYDGSRDGVIERARLVGSNTDSEVDPQEPKQKKETR